MRVCMSLGTRLLALMLVGSGVVVSAQTTAGPGATKSDAEVQKEELQAQAMFGQQNYMGALPLFEDLHIQRPTNNKYREGLALCRISKAGQLPPAESAAMLD